MKKYLQEDKPLNPFALLERAFLEGNNQPERNEQDKQNLPLLKTVCHSLVQIDETVHQSFVPFGYTRTKEPTLDNHSSFSQTSNTFQKEMMKTLIQEESIVVLNQNQKQISHLLKNIMLFGRKTSKKILVVCQNEHLEGEIQITLRINQKSKKQNSFFQVITITKLRTTIFQDMSVLNSFSYAFFLNISVEDQRFQEILITLPLQTNYLILFRQQMNNIGQIMSWLAKLRYRPFHLIYEKRKVKLPLIYGVTPLSKAIYQLVDKEGKVDESNVERLNKSLQSSQLIYGKQIKKQINFQENLKDNVKLLYSLEKFPIIYYASSKRNVQKYARILCQKLDFTSKEEKQKIQLYFQTSLDFYQQANSIKCFSKAKEFLFRGIGIYHEGLLQLLKQLVILLSKQNLLKVIVTNHISDSLPFKSLLVTQQKANNAYYKSFESLITRKDNQDKLILLHFEEKIQDLWLISLLSRNKKQITSKFHLTLYKYLNYQTFQDMDAQYVLARTFKQLQNHQKVEQLKAQEAFLQQEINKIVFQDIQPVKALHEAKLRKTKIEQQLLKKTYTPENVIPYLSVGRIVSLQVAEVSWGLGIVVNFTRFQQVKNEVKYFIDALVYVTVDPVSLTPQPVPLTAQQGKLQVVTFQLSCIKQIKTIKFSSLPNNLKQPENKLLLQKSLKKLQKLEIKTVNMQVQNRQVSKLKDQLKQVTFQLSKLNYLEPIYSEYLNKFTLEKQIQTVRQQIVLYGQLFQKDRLKSIHKIAKNMDYISKKRLTHLGKAISCLESRFSMMIIQLMKQNFYKKLSGAQIAALTVALIENEKANTQRLKVANLRLRDGLNIMLQKQKEMCKIMKKYKLEIFEEQQQQNIKEQYIEAILHWSQGQQLQKICNENSIYQGVFLEIAQKLIGLLGQMRKAASILSLKQTEIRLNQALTQVSRGLANINTFLL